MDVGQSQSQENELHPRKIDLRFFVHHHRDGGRLNFRGGDGRLVACHDDEAQCYEPA